MNSRLIRKLYKLRCRDILRSRNDPAFIQTRSTLSEAEVKSPDFSSSPVPSSARVVIGGGGVVGCSVAYHLAKDHGWTDIVLLEQSRLGGGTTWHGSGLLGQVKRSGVETKMCQYSINLYKELESQGLKTGWKKCGSLLLARTDDRMTAFRRLAATAESMNIEYELLTPETVHKRCEIINPDGLKGGIWIPGDGVGDPFDICITLTTEASKLGVTVVEGCAVKKVLTDEHQRVRAVETERGTIQCDYFVNSAGFWARHVGQMSSPRVKVPLYPCEHHFLHTLPVSDIDPMMPVIRDYDGYFYVREKNGRYLAGGFEPVSKPVDMKDLPAVFKPIPEDWDQFHVILEQILYRIPSMGDIMVDRLCNGPECFTPDTNWIIGEAPEIRNYFVASGMKSIGIEAAGGVGKTTADWIVNGEPAMDFWDLDIRRFVGLHNNRLFLRDRMREVPGLHYKLTYPLNEFETGRGLRLSPIFPRLKDAGAVFNQVMGYERPAYFEPDREDKHEACRDPTVPSHSVLATPYDQEGPLQGRIARTQTYGKPPWFNQVRSEYFACRERVGILDYSSFTKFELWSPGREVVDLLQYLCPENTDIPIGSIIPSGMQNKWGGYENDCVLIRLAETHYMLMAPTDQQTRCYMWISRNIQPGRTVVITDVTSMYTALCIVGPCAQTLMGELTQTNVNPRAFPFFTYREMEIGAANGVRVLNIPYTGEFGYILCIPNEYALHVYDLLLEVGAKHGIQHAGYYAMRTMRIEKFYAFWGQDIDTTSTPFECGRGFKVKFNKGADFIGKEALLKQKEEGVKRRYIQLVLDNHDIDNDSWPWGGEPIFLGDKWVGKTTSAGYGFTLGKHVCLGYVRNINDKGEEQVVTNDYILKNSFEVNIAGKHFPAKANIHSPSLSLYAEHH